MMIMDLRCLMLDLDIATKIVEASHEPQDGLFGAATAAQTQELCLQVTVLDSYRGPGGRDQCGFQPGRALAGTSGAAFAGTLVISGAHGGPRQQMSGGWEARQVGTDLRQHHLGGQLTDPRHGGQQASALSDRRQEFSHIGIHFLQCPLERCDQLEVQLEQPPVMCGDPTVQGLDQCGALFACRALRQIREALRIALSVDERGQDRSSWIGAGGTKLERIRPWASSSAIQAASFTSVLRPGTLRMCWSLASTNSRCSSSRCHTGFQ